MKVAIYIRESGSRQYKPASPRAAYSPNTTFCLRYTQDGKRKWEQLDVKSYKEAQAASLKKLTELITDSCKLGEGRPSFISLSVIDLVLCDSSKSAAFHRFCALSF